MDRSAGSHPTSASRTEDGPAAVRTPLECPQDVCRKAACTCAFLRRTHLGEMLWRLEFGVWGQVVWSSGTCGPPRLVVSVRGVALCYRARRARTR